MFYVEIVLVFVKSDDYSGEVFGGFLMLIGKICKVGFGKFGGLRLGVLFDGLVVIVVVVFLLEVDVGKVFWMVVVEDWLGGGMVFVEGIIDVMDVFCVDFEVRIFVMILFIGFVRSNKVMMISNMWCCCYYGVWEVLGFWGGNWLLWLSELYILGRFEWL